MTNQPLANFIIVIIVIIVVFVVFYVLLIAWFLYS